MTANTNRTLSDLPSGDPALLNKIAWARRWAEPAASTAYALAARKTALDGQGRRSRTEQGLALRTLGWQAFWRGDLSHAMDYCLQAETYLPETKFVAERGGIYAILGKVHTMRARLDLGMHSIERGLWLIGESDDYPAATADLLLSQASIQRLSRERARAGVTLGRVREMAEGHTLALVDAATASLLLDDGDATRANELALASVQTCEQNGIVVFLPLIRAVLAGTCLALSKQIEAREQISTGLRSLTDSEDMLARSMLLQREAQYSTAKDDIGKAIEVLSVAADIARAQTFKLHSKAIALASAHAFETQGDFQAAVEQHKIAWRLQGEIRFR
jgi:tetratricopeptide (TPR) repeat protein